MARSYRFSITGAITVPADAKLVRASSGEVVGFCYGGHKYLPVLGLEVDEGTVITTDDDMLKHDFQVTDYADIEFTETT